MSDQTPLLLEEPLPSQLVAIIVQQGKLLDFIDGKTQRRETPEEYVRQEIAKSLVREYRYSKTDIEVEFVVRVGTRKPRADLVIFPPQTMHDQESAEIIVECKASTVKSADKKDGVGQLQSYMAACPNVQYGMWTNGIERFCYRRVVKGGKVATEEVPDVPEFGRGDEDAERPRFDQLKAATSDALLFAFRRCHNYIAGNQGLQKPQAFWELLKLIFCKIHDERQNDEVEFYAAANERHGVNGPLKVQKRIEALFSQVKADYLRAPQVRAMATGAQYGHIIKHLETSHLKALPVPTVDDGTAADFSRRVSRIIALRNEGHRLTLEAEAQFEKALGPLNAADWGEKGFSIKASKAFLSSRRRLDASIHNPGVAAIRRHLAKHGEGFASIASAGYDVWVPGRYKRIPAEDGVIYRDSADLLEVSPDLMKRFADCHFGDKFRGRVKSGWILIPCSGQVYGIIGTAILATEALDNQVVSNHVIRVAPRKGAKMREGYVVTALSHLAWGRPLVKSLAFGSSVPEIDSEDLAHFEVVHLKSAEESAIADLAEASAKVRAEADVLERDIAKDAAAIIDRFIGRGKT